MLGWHHRLNGHEVEQALGDSEGGGSLVCCSPWGHKELNRAERRKNHVCICMCVCVCVCQTMTKAVTTNHVEQGSSEQPQAVGEGQKCWLDQLVREGLRV